jgi:hypothetical protein
MEFRYRWPYRPFGQLNSTVLIEKNLEQLAAQLRHTLNELAFRQQDSPEEELDGTATASNCMEKLTITIQAQRFPLLTNIPLPVRYSM